MANNTKHITEKYVTGKGELTGFIALIKPSTKYNKQGTYTANILLSKEEGELLTQKIKDVRTEQFKAYGKGTKVAELPIAPYEIVDPDTGEASPDAEGRYLLKTSSSAYIENGKIGRKIQIVNAKKQPVKNVSIGEGTIARLGIVLSGYSVAGKTGVSAKVGLVQIINLVEFSSSGFSLDTLDEEEGFDGVGEEFTEDTVTETTTTDDEADDGEADF